MGACLEEGGREVGLDGILGCRVSWVFVMLCGITEGAWGDSKGVLKGVWVRGSRGESEGVGSLEKRNEGKDKVKRKRRRKGKKRGTLSAPPAASTPFLGTSNRLVR